MKYFAENLRNLRKERKLTQKDMADKLNISVNSFSQYELGNTEPNILNLIKLADFFCVTVDYLIGAPVKANANTGEILDSEEKNLIKYYRGMSNVSKNAIMVTAESFYKSNIAAGDTKIG